MAMLSGVNWNSFVMVSRAMVVALRGEREARRSIWCIEERPKPPAWMALGMNENEDEDEDESENRDENGG